MNKETYNERFYFGSHDPSISVRGHHGGEHGIKEVDTALEQQPRAKSK